jgi:hypothetical protein
MWTLPERIWLWMSTISFNQFFLCIMIIDVLLLCHFSLLTCVKKLSWISVVVQNLCECIPKWTWKRISFCFQSVISRIHNSIVKCYSFSLCLFQHFFSFSLFVILSVLWLLFSLCPFLGPLCLSVFFSIIIQSESNSSVLLSVMLSRLISSFLLFSFSYLSCYLLFFQLYFLSSVFYHWYIFVCHSLILSLSVLVFLIKFFLSH